jgi:5-formaminoimidazole-4-carboxamide-1-(beta)-D-ribofuranosyl 5'-monophosphate synthetase
MGDKTVKASMELFPPGMIGPFCLETFCRADLKFVTFEISARIVAGTSVYATGSPYAVYDWGAKEEMSMSKRIAREIKIAARTDRLKEVIV